MAASRAVKFQSSPFTQSSFLNLSWSTRANDHGYWIWCKNLKLRNKDGGFRTCHPYLDGNIKSCEVSIFSVHTESSFLNFSWSTRANDHGYWIWCKNWKLRNKYGWFRTCHFWGEFYLDWTIYAYGKPSWQKKNKNMDKQSLYRARKIIWKLSTTLPLYCHIEMFSKSAINSSKTNSYALLYLYHLYTLHFCQIFRHLSSM